MAQSRCGELIITCRVHKIFEDAEWKNTAKETFPVNGIDTFGTVYGYVWDDVNHQWNISSRDSLIWVSNGYQSFHDVIDSTGWHHSTSILFLGNPLTKYFLVKLGIWDTVRKISVNHLSNQVTEKVGAMKINGVWLNNNKSILIYDTTNGNLQNILFQNWDSISNQWKNNLQTEFTYSSNFYNQVEETDWWDSTSLSWKPLKKLWKNQNSYSNLFNVCLTQQWDSLNQFWVNTDSIIHFVQSIMGMEGIITSSYFHWSNPQWNAYATDSACWQELGAVNEIITSSLQIFPNPASNKIVFSCLNRNAISKIEIVNLVGETERLNFSGRNEIDISKLQRGMYFLKITFSDGTVAENKFYKED